MLKERLHDRSELYVIGHRGAAGYAPENTMVSFQRAIALRANAIELDIHPTKDGQLVVLHDATLDRTTNGHGFVVQHTLAEIQALDAGSWFEASFKGERVPSLEEVLRWAYGRVNVVIEIKQGPIFYPQIADLLLATLDQTQMRSEVLVISFDHATVQQIKQKAPEIFTGVLYAGRPINPINLARDAGADALLPHWASMTRSDVEAAHQAGLVVAPWGGPEQDYAFILSLGVNAVAADFPDRPRLAVGAAQEA